MPISVLLARGRQRRPALVRTGLLALTLLAAVALLPVLNRHWRRPRRLTLHQ